MGAPDSTAGVGGAGGQDDIDAATAAAIAAAATQEDEPANRYFSTGIYGLQ